MSTQVLDARGTEGITMQGQLAMRVEADGTRVKLLVDGELDMVTQERFSSMLAELLREWDSVELDMSGVTFIDSTGVHALIRAACPSMGAARVSLGRRSSTVDRVLGLLGVDDRLQMNS